MTTAIPAPNPGRGLAATFWIATLAALALYAAGLAPTFAYGDFADLPLRVLDGSEAMFVNSPRDYVLYRALGRVFALLPAGDLAWRINLMTALFGALSVGVAAAIGHALTGDRTAGLATGAILGVSHTFWLLSEMAEVYTLAVLLALVLAFSLLQWDRTRRSGWLLAAGLAFGLGLAHHAAALLLGPAALAALVLSRRGLRPGPLLGAVALAGLGAIPLVVMFERLRHVPPGTFAMPPSPGLAGQVRAVAMAGAFLVYQFPGPALVLGAVGAWRLVRSRTGFAAFVVLAFACTWGWSIAARVPDKYNAYVFAYPFFALAAGAGLPRALAWARRHGGRGAVAALLAGLVLLPPVTYVAAPLASRAMGIDLVRARTCPYRDNAWFFLFPPKTGFRGARRYAEETFSEVAPGAVIVADYSLWRPLRYLQVAEGRRPDVELVFVEPLLRTGSLVGLVRDRLARRPVYLAADTPPEYYGLDELRRSFAISRRRWVARVEARPPAPLAADRADAIPVR